MIQIKMCCADVKRPLQKIGFLRFFVTKGEIPPALFGTCHLLFANDRGGLLGKAAGELVAVSRVPHGGDGGDASARHGLAA